VAGGIVEELRRNLLGLDTHGFYHFVALEKTKNRALVSARLPIAPGSGGQTVPELAEQSLLARHPGVAVTSESSAPATHINAA